MKSILILSLALTLYAYPGHINAQSVTFSEHISPILNNHCISCHRSGEIAPMPLTSYDEAAAYADMIRYVTDIRYMPPWKPDPTYSRMVGENTLTTIERQLITKWAEAGAPRGDPSLEAEKPEFSPGSALGIPDLVLSMRESFTIPGNNNDHYQVFVLPTGLEEDKEIAAVEFRPGNREIVHHALLAADTTGIGRTQDFAISGYGYPSFGGFGSPVASLLPSYTPGAQSLFFPKGVAQKLQKGSDILVQVHYAPWPVPASDSSTVNIFFKTESADRHVRLATMVPFATNDLNILLTPDLDDLINNLAEFIGLDGGTIDILELLGRLQDTGNALGISNEVIQLEFNEPFAVPANEIKEFHGTLKVSQEISLLSIYPHMHLLGKSWEVYAVNSEGKQINLIRIQDWDFNWQGSYNFEKFVKISAGSEIHAKVVYDNTSENPLNPNSPPKQLSWGEKTTDEMLLLALYYVPYREGDEFTLLATGTSSPSVRSDFNQDGAINFQDFLLFAAQFGTRQESPQFEPGFDLNQNGSVDFADFLTFAGDFSFSSLKPAIHSH